MTEKPCAPACERNREPILAVLRDHLAASGNALEIGSGTGQHAVYFAHHLPHVTWQTSDRPGMLPGIRQWLAEAALPNTPPPLALDVNGEWPTGRWDAVFTANTLHIMSWDEVECLFARLPAVLAPRAQLVVYGPFKYLGRHTSASNVAFDIALAAAAAERRVRDFEAVDALARAIGLTLVEDRAMPANNRCLVWRSA